MDCCARRLRLPHHHHGTACIFSDCGFGFRARSRSSSVFLPKSTAKLPTSNCLRIRRFPLTRASANENPSTIPDKPNPETDPLSLSLLGLRQMFKVDGLGLEILSIAMPAALALAADPFTSLVNTAFVGHLELASVGVSGAIFNLVSKLFNVPLLNVTTSFVAEEQATVHTATKDQEGKLFLPSVSSALMLAATLGIIEAIMLFVGSSNLMTTMGIPVDSSMRSHAEHFLSLRAIGAPAIVLALAAQGTFRGFKDTKTPLYAVGKSITLLRTLWYLTAFILLLKLNDKVQLIAPKISGQRVSQYLNSGALLTGRTVAVLLTTTIATSMAARQGPVEMAGYQICFQVWLALSLLNDALALAGQTLLASDFSQGNYEPARRVACKVLQIGLMVGSALAVTLFLGFGPLSSLFSTDSEVLKVARSGTVFVAASQPMNAIAFVMDGLYYGVSDFRFAAYSMIIVGLISCGFLKIVGPYFGLGGVWCGLFLFMTLRVVAGMIRSTKHQKWTVEVALARCRKALLRRKPPALPPLEK
ncbi:hypothetical protein M569_03747 [Genlisea aurea]|uniref:Protein DETOXIFICATION n=1 Tax=Genlisea aurea TaxID=192259 RepID=S8D100_9LAMI|nr:hypothetical protein M569_03747 [Genlisea aurea]